MKRFAVALALSAVAAVSAAGMGACAHHRPSEDARGAPAYLTIRNQLPLGYQLYVTDGSQNLDVGTIAPLQTVQIRVPRRVVYPGAHLALVAVPSVSGRTQRIRFVISPGATQQIILGR